jgi:hypothetical protein
VTTAADFSKATRRETILRVSVIGLFIGVTLVWLIAGVFQVPLTPDNFTNSYSASPGGHKAFVRLLKDNGREVRADVGRLALPAYTLNDGATRMLLEPRGRYMAEYEGEVEGLLNDAQRIHSSVVLVLPKREYSVEHIADDDKLVLREEVYRPGDHQRLMTESGFDRWFRVARDQRSSVDVLGDGPVSRRRVECTIDEPVQVLRPLIALNDLPDNVEVIARTDRNDVIAVRLRVDPTEQRGGFILVSDPDMVSNAWLGREGMADMAMLMLDAAPPRGEIVIDELLHGFGEDASLEYLAATPPGLWVSLSVLLLLGVFAWRQGTVLRPIAAEAQDRAARRYAIEGLGRMLERNGSHMEAVQRIIKRSALVLGDSGVTVQEAGKGTSVLRAGEGRVRLEGETSGERLVNIARRVSEQKRSGETGGAEVWSD